jgi:glycosyltransferase involved in cell wall biosynthesis
VSQPLNRKLLFLTDLPAEDESAPVSRLVNLAAISISKGLAVEVVGSHSDRPATHDSVRVRALPINSGRKHQALFPFRKVVRRAIREADGLVVRGYWIGYFALRLARTSGMRIRILDFHGRTRLEQGDSLAGRIADRMERASFKLATHILVVSEGVAEQVPAEYADKLVPLGNGVDLRAFRDVPNRALAWLPNASTGERTIGIVARFGANLELDTICRALPHLNHPTRLVLIGDGPAVDRVRAKGDTSIIVAGRQPTAEVRCFLSHHCDAALAPYNPDAPGSRNIGFFASRKTREYLAAGCPVLVPSIPGLDSLYVPGENCLVYDASSPESLATQVDRLVDEPGLADQLRENGRRTIEAYSWEKIVRKSGILEQLVAL